MKSHNNNRISQNDIVLDELFDLNWLCCTEGLLLLLRKFSELYAIFYKRNSMVIVMFAPQVDGLNIDSENIEDMPSESILEKAQVYCEQNKLDCSACKIFVNNISFKVRQRELWDFFEYFGKVLRCSIVKDRKTKKSRGFAFVVFANPVDAKRAVSAKSYELRLHGRLMVIDHASKKNKSERFKKNEVSSKKNNFYSILEQTEDVSKSEDRVGSISLIDQLCDELILHIFKFLEITTKLKIESVSKKWRMLSIESWCFVEKLEFKNMFQAKHRLAGLSDSTLISIMKKGCFNLKSIDLSASPYLVSHEGLCVLASTCKKLEHLNLSMVPVQNKTLKHLGSNLKNLKKLQLSHCINVGEKGLWWLLKDLKYLEYLQIADTSRLNGKCLYMLPDTIKTVDLKLCPRLSDSGLKNLALRCTNIKYLDLSFCTSITDDGLQVLLQSCSNISQLNLKALSVTSDGFKNIKYLKDLTSLDISRNRSIDDNVINVLTRCCINLQTLNIEACHGDVTCDGIKRLALFEKLTYLNISYLISVCDTCISELSLHDRLEVVVARSCPSFTNEGALKCIQSLRSLHQLDLSGCYTISDRLLEHLVLGQATSDQTPITVAFGGTEVTKETVENMKSTLPWINISLKNYSVGMLKNERDPTFYGSMFSDDEDDEDYDDNVEQPEYIHRIQHEDDIDINENFPKVDEDGYDLWVVENAELVDTKQDNYSTVHETIETSLTSSVINDDELDEPSREDEDWENELEEQREWHVPVEHLTEQVYIDYDGDDLQFNDPLLNELHG